MQNQMRDDQWESQYTDESSFQSQSKVKYVGWGGEQEAANLASSNMNQSLDQLTSGNYPELHAVPLTAQDPKQGLGNSSSFFETSPSCQWEQH